MTLVRYCWDKRSNQTSETKKNKKNKDQSDQPYDGKLHTDSPRIRETNFTKHNKADLRDKPELSRTKNSYEKLRSDSDPMAREDTERDTSHL